MSKKNRKEVEAIVSAMGIFTSIISDLVKFVKKLGGTIEDIYRLALPEGSETLENVARFIVNGTIDKNEFLKPVYSDFPFAIRSCDGSKILLDVENRSDFEAFMINEPAQATPDIPVEMYEMVKDGNYSQLFGSLSNDIDKLCLTQNQIDNFVNASYGSLLEKDGRETFFLFKSNEHFLIAYINFARSGSSRILFDHFGNSRIWRSKDSCRIIIPRLEKIRSFLI